MIRVKVEQVWSGTDGWELIQTLLVSVPNPDYSGQVYHQIQIFHVIQEREQ